MTVAVDIGPHPSGKRPNVVDWTGFDACGLPFDQQVANARFIAAAPETAAERDRLKAERDRLKALNDELLALAQRSLVFTDDILALLEALKITKSVQYGSAHALRSELIAAIEEAEGGAA
jgi:hypothetical protein